MLSLSCMATEHWGWALLTDVLFAAGQTLKGGCICAHAACPAVHGGAAHRPQAAGSAGQTLLHLRVLSEIDLALRIDPGSGGCRRGWN